MLCHKSLGHISNERVDRLIKYEILPSFHFGDLDTCVDCIRGKLTKTKKKGATHSYDLLEIVCNDISGHLISTLCGDKYFVTFIDDFSLYGYLYLIKEKYDAFENFKTEVEKQLEKVVKIVRFDRDDEYYG